MKTTITYKKWMLFTLIIILLLKIPGAFAQSPDAISETKPARKLKNTGPVNDFYRLVAYPPSWYVLPHTFPEIRSYFDTMLKQAIFFGLDEEKYLYGTVIDNSAIQDSLNLQQRTQLFTDALISYCKDLYSGADIAQLLHSDEVSREYETIDNNYLVNRLAGLKSLSDLKSFLITLEPNDPSYMALKNELKNQVAENNELKIKQLAIAMNLYRWIHHFHFDKYIVVNIPSATLQYYEGGRLKTAMKVVVGKASTKTPIFSSWCNQVILYPYWNVPKSIGNKELLPRFKKSPASMATMNMQLIDNNGNVTDPHSVNWAAYDQSNFPYVFRQSTGCDNALGVIKFNLTDPFEVYLHDTNLKNKFLSTSRYFSHGCIRVERPVELGNYLLNNTLDSNLVLSCIKGQNPIVRNLDKPVPVFVVYMTAQAESDTITYNKDVYGYFKK